MKPVLLIDFGSTYTKVTAVDVESERLLGTADAYTTVQTDVGEGLANALTRLREKIGPVEFTARYACSSAAGGLRMIASGLVPELTAEAARQASLCAGAKVLKVYSFQLTEDDLDEILRLNPDIFLLVGGTDGGNSECILHNAHMLASGNFDFPVVIAGNRSVARECERILAGHEVYVCENVMPRFGVLNIESAQKKIREIFLNRIIEAKGLTRAAELISGILMPTPSAVMKAMNLLAQAASAIWSPWTWAARRRTCIPCATACPPRRTPSTKVCPSPTPSAPSRATSACAIPSAASRRRRAFSAWPSCPGLPSSALRS